MNDNTLSNMVDAKNDGKPWCDYYDYVCREGHVHDGGHPDGAKCPEERVSDLIGKGVDYDEAVERVYGS